MRDRKKLQFIAESAVTAALYAAMTYAAAALNLAFGPVQVRFSEALTVLPAFMASAVPGLSIGCFLANLTSPLGAVDILFGTAATLIAAVSTRMLRGVKLKGIPILAPLPPVIFNALVVGAELSCISNSGVFDAAGFSFAAFWPAALSVGAGELIACFGLGIPLMLAIKNTKIHSIINQGKI